jgi:hypothetical protein
VPPTRTGFPEGAARPIAGAASIAVEPNSPAKTWRRRHEPTRSRICFLRRRVFDLNVVEPDRGGSILVSKSDFRNFRQY